jgi:hypothetical protein
MLTTGSKLFYGMAGAALVAAVVYGVISNGFGQGGVLELLSSDGAVNALLGPLTFGYKGGVGDHVGYAVLMGFSVCTFGMGIATSAFRDADADALASLTGLDTVGLVSETNGPNYWPIVSAFGIALVVIGLATQPVTFIIGLVVLIIAALEWTISGWAEQLSGDQEANRRYRSKLLGPIEVPVAVVIGIAAVVFCVSRILLAVSKAGSTWIALGVAAVIFGVAVLLSTRQKIGRNVVAAVILFAALAILAAGIVGGIAGTREIEEHHGEEGALPAVVVVSLGENA